MPGSGPKDGLLNLVFIDDLTGAYNRRYLNIFLPQEIDSARNKKTRLSLLMIDCDGFKQINDTYGHIVGDNFLVGISAAMKGAVSSADILARYAGDEFTVILPHKGKDEAFKTAEDLLQRVSSYSLQIKGKAGSINATISVGLAVYPDDGASAMELLDKADQALFSAKRMGKSRVCTTKELADEVRDRALAKSVLPCKRFVDRDKELGYLRKAYADAKKGKKAFILLEGTQGAGKTRLVEEFMSGADMAPALYIKCQKEQIEQPYGAVSRAIGRLLKSAEPGTVLSAVNGLDDDLKYAVLSTIEKADAMPIEFPKAAAFSEKDLSDEKLFEAYTSLLVRLGMEAQVIVVDDALWIDSASLKVVEWAFNDARMRNVLILGTVRKGTGKDFLSPAVRDKAVFFDVAPLAKNDSKDFLTSVLNGAVMPQDVQDKIYGLSGGVPAAMEEVIRSMIDRKMVFAKRGKWEMAKMTDVDVPASMNDMMRDRMAGMDDETADVAYNAAALGDGCDISLLKTLYGKNEGWLLDILDKLCENGLLRHERLRGEDEVSFVNNAVRDRIYGIIEKEKARALHKKIADTLSERPDLDVGRSYGNIVYHLKAAGEIDKIREIAESRPLPPYVRPQLAEELSEEEAVEAPLSEKSREIAAEAVFCIRASWINAQLYPIDNQTRIEAISNLYRHVSDILQNDVTLTVTAAVNDLLVNGEAVGKKKIAVLVCQALCKLFADYSINSITFKRGLTRKELDSLFFILSQKEGYAHSRGCYTNLIKNMGIANIRIDVVRYKKLSDMAAPYSAPRPDIILKDLENLLQALGRDKDYAKQWSGGGQSLSDILSSLSEGLPSKDGKAANLSVVECLCGMMESAINKESYDIVEDIAEYIMRRLNEKLEPSVCRKYVALMETAAELLLSKQNLALGIKIADALSLASEDSKKAPDFRNLCGEALDKILKPENLTQIFLSFKRKTEKERLTVAHSLSKFGDRAAASFVALLKMAEDIRHDPFDIYMKKRYIAVAMDKIGKRAISELAALLNDKRPFVAKNGIDILLGIGNATSLAVLEAATSHPDAEIRKEVAAAIKKIKKAAGQS